MKWYEENIQRFEEEFNQLSAHGLKVSISNAGYGDMYAVSERLPGHWDVLIYFPEKYPSEPPRYYLTSTQNIPSYPDGAADLKQLGISWSEQKRALDILNEIARFNHFPSNNNSDLKAHKLTLKNLTKYFKEIDTLGFAGREKEIRNIEEAMIRQENAGCVLTGRPGVGKTALAYRFIQEAGIGNVPPMLKSMTFYELRLEDILASSQFMGDAERAIKRLLERPGILGLFVDEVHRMANPSLSQVADAIKPEMASGKIRIIGASTYDEWRRVEDGALKRRLAVIDVPEPSLEETYMMIKEKASKLRQHYGLEFTDETIKRAIGLGKLYINDPAYPAKAADLLDRAAASQTVNRYIAESKTINEKEKATC